MPNRLSQFWKELKRRNVTRVLAVYIAAAFMLLELISMFSEQIGLPDGTWKVAFIISLAGLVVAAIVSWVYDIHPEGGIVKTEPVKEDKLIETTFSSNRWKIASYISFVVIVGLIVLNIITRTGNRVLLEKSIAVLPFENMSSNEEDNYLGRAFCDEIIMELQKIKSFDRVLSRTSTMQFEKNRPTIPEIAEILNVNYIVEGSIQRSQDKIRVHVLVIRAENEDHIWGDEYDREWKDIFSIQDEIAFHVAKELQLTLSPEEVDLIEEKPTTNMTAYELYLKGNDEFRKVSGFNYNHEYLNKAQNFFENAIKYDSSYALAYLGLAKVYRWKGSLDNFNQALLDSAILFSNTSLSINSDLSEAYAIRALCYYYSGKKNEAEKGIQQALELNPNDWYAYFVKGYINYRNDFLAAIKNFHLAADLLRGEGLIEILQNLAAVYNFAGFKEKSEELYVQILEITGDSALYYRFKGATEWQFGNDELSADYYRKSLEFEPDNLIALRSIAVQYARIGENKQSLKYLRKYLSLNDDVIPYNEAHRIGYVYWVNGIIDTADYFFNVQLDYSLKNIESNDMYASLDYYSYYDAAGVYSQKGNTEKAIEYLRVFNKRRIEAMSMVTLINNDPLFDYILDEPEFKQIVRDVEAKYQAEHERVRQWLDENNML